MDKEIRSEFKKLRKEVSTTEKKILKLDIKADRERERLKHKLHEM